MTSLTTIQELIRSLHTSGDHLCLLAFERRSTERWTYAELASQVQRLTRGLIRAGVAPGDYVVLLAKNRPEWIVACLAVINTGAAIVPLDVQIGDEPLQRVLDDCGARFVFTTSEYLARLDKLSNQPAIQPILLDTRPEDARSWQALLSDEALHMPTVGPEATATMFYTSGTTGAPKGVPLTHRNLAFQVNAFRRLPFLSAQDRVLQPLPMYHVYPFTVGILSPLAIGLQLVMPQSVAGPHIVRALQESQATVIIAVPRLYRALYQRIESQAKSRGRLAAGLFRASLALSIWLRRHTRLKAGRWLFRQVHRRISEHLRVMASGGSALDPDLAWKLEGLGWHVSIGYGLTETSPMISLKLPDIHPPRLASVGQHLIDVELRIDPYFQQADGAAPQNASAAPREEGEILARGPCVFGGYHNLPDQTAEVLSADGWFRTGDLGCFDENGFLYISGRASTLIVTEGGKNIQPEPVEEVYVQNQHISEIGVLQYENRLVGLIVPDTEAIGTQDSVAVKQAIRESVAAQSKRLPTYQRIRHHAITWEPLPRTNLGKLRRHLMVERYEQAERGDN